MPYAIRKMPKRNCYKVFNKNTKKIFAKCASMKNAQKQLRLLRALQNNPKFRTTAKRVIMIKIGGKTRKKYKVLL